MVIHAKRIDLETGANKGIGFEISRGIVSRDVTVVMGADIPIRLATLPDDGPPGGFFRERRLIPW